MLSHARAESAAAEAATWLAGAFGLERVAIGLVERHAVELLAVSHGASLDRRQDFNTRIVAAMDEAIDQGTAISLPQAADSQAQPRITLAHAELSRNSGNAVCTIPFIDPASGELAGALMFERQGAAPFEGRDLALGAAMVGAIAPLLLLKRGAELAWWQRLAADGRSFLTRLRQPGQYGFKAMALLPPLALLLLVLAPLPYHVNAPVRLEGAIQRALVANDDGFIQQVMVRPGDLVKTGQLLVEMAQQDLLVQRSKLESELAQQEGAYGMALASADRGQLIASQAKADQARAQLELIAQQIERASIRAPFDGVIISGDLTQSLGAPVQRGGLLMVVAPRDRYRLIVEADERDINDVAIGAAGAITLAAMPDQSIAFRTERIAPVAVTRNGRHFFEVEGRLDSTAVTIRPGLEGVARIEAPSRSLASAWGHRVWVWLRMSLWSLGWWQ